jgi:hypothetical protein
MLAAVAQPRNPNTVRATSADFPDVELALGVEILSSAVEADVLRAGELVAQQIHEEEGWMIVEGAEQFELEATIAPIANPPANSALSIPVNALIHQDFPSHRSRLRA